MAVIRERDGRFQAIVRRKVNGIVIHQESKVFDRERAARAWAAKVEESLDKGGVKERRATSTTFAELMVAYRKSREHGKRLAVSTDYALRRLENLYGMRRLDSFTTSDWVEYAKQRRATKKPNGPGNVGPATVLRELHIARGVFNAASTLMDLGINGNHIGEAVARMKKLGVVAEGQARNRRPTQDELDRLALYFDPQRRTREVIIPMHRIIPLAIVLPRRVGELCSMLWDDYDEERGTLLLRDTKHPVLPRNELIPVPPLAREMLKTLPRTSEFILPAKSNSVSWTFMMGCRAMDIHDLHFHDLRHEGISRLFEAGWSTQEVALVSGHLTWEMLQRYTHLKPEDVAKKHRNRVGPPGTKSA